MKQDDSFRKCENKRRPVWDGPTLPTARCEILAQERQDNVHIPMELHEDDLRCRTSPHLRPNNGKATGSLALRSLLSGRPYRASRYILYFDEFFDGEYHAGCLGCVGVVYGLHATSQTERGERPLDAISEGDRRTSEGDAEVCVCLWDGW
jgi:hypothetical protein